jgi:hypothetical protein
MGSGVLARAFVQAYRQAIASKVQSFISVDVVVKISVIWCHTNIPA